MIRASSLWLRMLINWGLLGTIWQRHFAVCWRAVWAVLFACISHSAACFSYWNNSISRIIPHAYFISLKMQWSVPEAIAGERQWSVPQKIEPLPWQLRYLSRERFLLLSVTDLVLCLLRFTNKLIFSKYSPLPLSLQLLVWRVFTAPSYTSSAALIDGWITLNWGQWLFTCTLEALS